MTLFYKLLIIVVIVSQVNHLVTLQEPIISKRNNTQGTGKKIIKTTETKMSSTKVSLMPLNEKYKNLCMCFIYKL